MAKGVLSRWPWSQEGDTEAAPCLARTRFDSVLSRHKALFGFFGPLVVVSVVCLPRFVVEVCFLIS